MKRIVTILAVGALAIPMGCNRGTSGGPGATDPATSPSITGQAEDTFSLSVSSTSLNQGDTKNVTIDISRGRNFGQDVSVEVGTLPNGITLSPSSPIIKQGDADIELALTATRDAALGTFTIDVTGHPATGAAAVAQMKLSVAEYDSDDASHEADAAEREAWQQALTAKEAEVERLAEEHQSLIDRANDASGDTKTRLEHAAEEVKERLEVAQASLDEQKATTPSTWTRLKDSVSSASGY